MINKNNAKLLRWKDFIAFIVIFLILCFFLEHFLSENSINKRALIMKNNRTIAFATLLFLCCNFLPAQTNAWHIKKGEVLKYKVAFSSGLTGDIKGGDAIMSVASGTSNIRGKKAYHAMLKGGTSGVVEWFYQVENKYESYIDTETNTPLMYAQFVRENKYRNNDTVYFDQKKNVATYKDKMIKIPENTHDFVSMLYYVRTLDMSKLTKGDTFTIPFFTSAKVVSSKIIYNGIEKVKTKKMGIVECYSFKPQVSKGKVFNQDYPATMWVSTDSNRLPVLVEARMKVGKMKMELIKAE